MRDAILIGNTPVGYESSNPIFSKGDLPGRGHRQPYYVPINLNNTYKTNLRALSGSPEDQNILSLIPVAGNTLKAAFYKANQQLIANCGVQLCQ